MEPIYGRNGETVAWLDNDVIRDTYGHPSAFLRNDNIVSYGGEHLGRFGSGLVRDRYGAVVAFTIKASGGPTLPVPRVTPVPPVLAVERVRPVAPVAPVAPLATLIWSSLDWQAFMG